ncbi:MAG: septum formation initiator family protein [Coriobacteriales bacterium]|jgi:cell division protein FtsB|nr:septum formation initiator family protein [Coriobacteriales bacterium]
MTKRNTTERAVPRAPVAAIVAVAALFCLAFMAFMLYPVAREYYLVMRENEQVSAEYQAVLDRNERIRRQIEDLQTPEGIEDRAREEFGWVKEGEEAVNITGLKVSDSSTGLPPAVGPDAVDVPETWLTQTLDEFFGIRDAVPAVPDPDDLIPAP